MATIDNVTRVLEALVQGIEEATAPEIITKREAVLVLDLLLDEIESRIEAINSELEEGEDDDDEEDNIPIGR